MGKNYQEHPIALVIAAISLVLVIVGVVYAVGIKGGQVDQNARDIDRMEKRVEKIEDGFSDIKHDLGLIKGALKIEDSK